MQRLERTPGLTLRTAHSGEEALAQLAQDDTTVVILDDSLQQPGGEEILSRARRGLGLKKTKVIYCLETSRLGSLSQDFSNAVGSGDRILFHPLDLEELLAEVVWALGFQPPRVDEAKVQLEDEFSDLAADVWEQFKAQIFQQVGTLEEASCALLDGTLNPDLGQKARREAHKLAGCLGSLGFERGTQLAREIEQTLVSEIAPGKPECLRVCDAVVELREQLERGPSSPPEQKATQQGSKEENPLLLVVDADSEVCSSLGLEAPRFSLRVEMASSIEAARAIISRETPAVILVDPCFPEGWERGIEFVSEVAARSPTLPVLVLTSGNSFDARLRLAHLGVQAFLEKPLPAPRVLDSVIQLLGRNQGSQTRVLALDHDPLVLVSLARLLEPEGVVLSTLTDPLQFWDALEGFSPDVLLLDADVPQLGGIELCRVLRNDSRWSGIPVLVSTVHRDTAMVQKVFAAGADDFVTKPIVGPELVARISNRLDRTRRLLRTAEKDGPSGVESFRTSFRLWDWLFRLSRRQKQPLCLVVLEPDDFAGICERYGQPAGDQLYRRLGQLLLGAFRSGDVVSRWEGDEFVVGLYGITRGDGVQRVAELLEALRQEEFSTTSGARFRASLSGGVAQYPEDGSEVQSLYHAAARAMREARRLGGDRVLSAGWRSGEGGETEGPDIVLVDDDETLSGLLRHTLQTRGYRTESFNDGKAALDNLGGPQPRLRPRVLLLDVDLPSLDGLAVLRRLAEDGVVKRTRVIMLTGRSSEAEIVSALEGGAFDHVAKPFSLRVLTERVRRAMEA